MIHLLTVLGVLTWGLIELTRKPELIFVFSRLRTLLPWLAVALFILLAVCFASFGLLLGQFPEENLIRGLVLTGSILLAVAAACYPPSIEGDETELWRPGSGKAVASLTGIAILWSMFSIGILMHLLEGKASEDFAFEGVSVERPLQYLTLLFFALAGAVLEEIIFRGGLIKALKRVSESNLLAIIVSSMLFALAHPSYIEPIGIKEFQIFGLGVIFAIARMRYGLGAAILLHVFNNLFAMLAMLLVHFMPGQ